MYNLHHSTTTEDCKYFDMDRVMNDQLVKGLWHSQI